MTFFRLFSALALSTALSLAMAGGSVAQSLSDSSLALNSDWRSGYMGLGGNLGRAIERHHSHRAQPIKSAKAPRAERHATRQHARPQPTMDTPIYLIVQSLDNSGLTINTQRLRPLP